MRECVERLIAAANGLSTASTGAEVSVQHTLTTATAGATATTPVRSTTPVTSALEEHRRIFGFRLQSGPAARRPSGASRGQEGLVEGQDCTLFQKTRPPGRLFAWQTVNEM